MTPLIPEEAQLRQVLQTWQTSLTSARLPIFQIDDGGICGYELLIRGPESLRNPEALFSLSAKAGLLCEIDRASLAVSLNSSTEIDANYRVHVNLFADTILQADLDELIAQFLATQRKLCIELIEMTAMPQPEELARRVKTMQQSGIEIAIDDVGFGSSAVETLVVLEPSVIKIDRRFVTGAHSDAVLARRCQRVVLIAKALGCSIVAEGVDTERDRVFLQDLGVDMGQGLLTGALPS